MKTFTRVAIPKAMAKKRNAKLLRVYLLTIKLMNALREASEIDRQIRFIEKWNVKKERAPSKDAVLVS